MAKNDTTVAVASLSETCINDALSDDGLREVLVRLEKEEEKGMFSLVCKRWLHLQSSERRKLRARAGPAMLKKMADRFCGLDELDLSQSASRSFYPGVTDSDLKVIVSGFQNLKVLNLQNCKGVTDTGMLTLGKGLPSLQSVDVSFCRKLTDNGLIGLAQECCNLRRLHLSNCKSVTDELLKVLSKNCTQLEDLVLSGCNNITDSGLLCLANGCPRIKSLDLSKCSKIGDVGISSISKVCSSSLNTLKLLDCYFVKDNSILTLADNCKNVETLVIGGCRYVSGEAIKSLVNSCRNSLRKLRMDWCSEITESALGYILLNCTNLVALDIAGCNEATDAIFHLLGGAKFELGLKVLKVSNCTRITVSGIDSLLKFCRHVEYLDMRSCPHITKLGCDQAGLVFPKWCKANFSGSLLEPDTVVDTFF